MVNLAAAHWVAKPIPTHRVVRITLPSWSGPGPFGQIGICGGGAVEVPTEEFHTHIMSELGKCQTP